jgi:hypothetical protein
VYRGVLEERVILLQASYALLSVFAARQNSNDIDFRFAFVALAS